LKEYYIKFKHFFKEQKCNFQASDRFIMKILSGLECRCFKPGEQIIKRGDKLQYLYFIFKGSALIMDEKEEKPLIVLPKYSWFGDYQIFMGSKSNVGVISSNDADTVCLCLDASKFLDHCKEHRGHYSFYLERSLARRRYWRRVQVQFERNPPTKPEDER